MHQFNNCPSPLETSFVVVTSFSTTKKRQLVTESPCYLLFYQPHQFFFWDDLSICDHSSSDLYQTSFSFLCFNSLLLNSLAELLPFVQKEKVTSAWKRKLQFHGQLARIVFFSRLSQISIVCYWCENSKKTVSLIEIVLGPLISAVTGVCNKKVSISTGFPRSGYANYWVSNVLNVVLFTVQLISACLYNLLREEVWGCGHFCCQSIGFHLSPISSYGNPTSMCQIWELLQDQHQMLNQRSLRC
jgi:hypothetical protein